MLLDFENPHEGSHKYGDPEAQRREHAQLWKIILGDNVNRTKAQLGQDGDLILIGHGLEGLARSAHGRSAARDVNPEAGEIIRLHDAKRWFQPDSVDLDRMEIARLQYCERQIFEAPVYHTGRTLAGIRRRGYVLNLGERRVEIFDSITGTRLPMEEDMRQASNTPSSSKLTPVPCSDAGSSSSSSRAENLKRSRQTSLLSERAWSHLESLDQNRPLELTLRKQEPIGVDCVMQFFYGLDYVPPSLVPPDDGTLNITRKPDLVAHVLVYQIADRYRVDINTLKRLSMIKFAEEMDQLANLDDFIAAATEVYANHAEYLDDRGLKEVVMGAFYQHKKQLFPNPRLQNLFNSNGKDPLDQPSLRPEPIVTASPLKMDIADCYSGGASDRKPLASKNDPMAVESKKPLRKRKSSDQGPQPDVILPHRKHAKIEEDKEMKRSVRAARNRRAAKALRDRKRVAFQALEKRNQELEIMLCSARKANFVLAEELDSLRRDFGSIFYESSLESPCDDQISLPPELFSFPSDRDSAPSSVCSYFSAEQSLTPSL
ncbi:transcriptional activator HAC1 [Akanthomyces lecanii RCEF 1005]|uniref:Transcriptional activator HAC1 n=1 Tax=Akanthomyces lecanii RCEF 1005 TaxID=1081108 RepID=A0A167W1W7_CORDF|nr:transcriptional activator HAC1 [Akanthomyces lecanii RCEF 1005]